MIITVRLPALSNGKTRIQLDCLSALSASSGIDASAKNSCSGSSLILTNGSTAIAGVSDNRRGCAPAQWPRSASGAGKGQFRPRFPQSAQLRLSDNDFSDPATDTYVISAQHFWTGGLETAGPGCFDAVAIARAAGSRNAGYEPHPSCGDYPVTTRNRPKRGARISRKIVAGQR